MGKIYFETEDSTIIEMYEDYRFLKYYKEHILSDIKFLNYYKEDDYNDVLLNHLNKQELKKYMDILVKYKKDTFNFEGSEWYEIYLDFAQTNKGYIYHLFDRCYIELTLRSLKHNLINFYKQK